MIKILKNHVCLCVLTTSVFSFVFNIDAYAQDSQSSCGSLFKSYSCDALGNAPVSYVDNFEIASGQAMVIMKTSNIVIKQGEKTNSKTDENLQLKRSGLITSEVIASQKAITVLDKVSVTGSGKKVVGRSNNGVKQAVLGVQQDGFLVFKNGKIDVSYVHGLVGESSPAIFSRDKSSLQLQGMSKVSFEDSNIVIKGHRVHGLHLQGSFSENKYKQGEMISQLGVFQFKKTNFHVPDGTAIYVNDARRFPYITVSEKSRISADQLLEVKNNSYAGVEANNSSLIGGVHVDENSYAELELSNKSQWTVAPRKNNQRQNVQSVDSSISFVRLINSSIVFKKPKDAYYQTLHIGELNGNTSDYAYVAHGDVRLLVNASFMTDDQNKGIKADKLLIYGDVYGTTKVHIVSGLPNSEKKKHFSQGERKDSESVSIIQVYGKATADSFKLPIGYATLKGSPYLYRLRAYGPDSAHGDAKHENKLIKQKQVNSIEGFWDFRLEPEYIRQVSARYRSKLQNIDSRRRVTRSAEVRAGHDYPVTGTGDSVLHSEVEVKAVVPQVPTYLLLPNSIFHAGLMDISNQNKQLEMQRATFSGMLEISGNPASFLRGYGGSYRYSSDLSAFEYGYGGDFNYNAIETGALLDTIENADIAVSFGVMGSYGKLSLQPVDVEYSQKSAFDKWTAAAYGSMQHDAGFYIDGILSYGLFQGDVLTLARGKTATLKGNSLSASLVSGKSFMTGHKGLLFDPQVQVIYQNLKFDKASDIDGFDIEMGKPKQWLMRVGGRLIKTLSTSKIGQIVSFNGKIHFSHSLKGKQSVHFKDAFQLGAFGSSLEAGLGFNAQLSSKFTFHGDVTYQHQLTKAGLSGARFSGGLRYRF
ncbi:outer membrane autotransporter protein [Bartonella silvatica]|uniref:Outer membrane autotransporter protein n=1 Tax=Bartonella silvatica TaxID=357760 RepID=A0ABV2HIK6_9HYPH